MHFKKLINQEGFDVVSLGIYLKGIIASVGIFYAKNVFNSLILRLSTLKKKKDIDENIISNLNTLLVESKKYNKKANQCH